MRYEIAKLHERLATTMIYVTHDQVEAMTLADRIVVLEFGKIAQVGTPRELYERPANRFVAQFIGSPKMNIFTCTSGDGTYHLEGGRNGLYSGTGAPVEAGIRPEHVELVPEGEGQCDGVVDFVEYLGADSFSIIDCGPIGKINVRTVGDAPHTEGDRVGLAFTPDHTHFFDEGGMRV